MGELLTNPQQGSFIPALEEEELSVSDKHITSLVKKASLAEEQLGMNYDESIAKNSALGSTNVAQLIRGDVAAADALSRRTASLQALNENVHALTVDQVANNLLDTQQISARQDAIEELYIERLATGKNESWRELASQNKGIYDRKSKELLFMHKLNAIREEFVGREAAEGWWPETIDFVKEITAIPNIIDFFNPLEGTLGTQVEDFKRLAGVIRNLPEDQKSEALIAFGKRIEDAPLLDNPQDMVDMIDRVNADPSSVNTEGLLLGLEFLGVTKVMSWLGKGAIKTVKGQKAFKPNTSPRGVTDDVDLESVTSRSVAGDDAVADDIVTGKFKLTNKDDLLNQTSMLTSPASAYGNSLSPYIRKAINRNSADLSDLVKKFTAPQRLAVLTQKAVVDFENSYVGRGVLGSSVDETTGNMVFTFGTKTEKPFATEATANQAIKKLQIEDGKGVSNVETIQTPHGWVVKVHSDTPDALKAWLPLGTIGRNIKSMEDVVPGLIGITRQAEDAQNAVVGLMEEVISRDLRKFFGKKGTNLRKVLDDMQNIVEDVKDPVTGKISSAPAPRWLSADQFAVRYDQTFNKFPTQDEVKGYVAFRQLNDFAYELKLKVMVDDITARNDKMFSINSASFDATYDMLGSTINRNTVLTKSSNSSGIMVMGDSPTYFARGQMTKKQMEDLEGLDIVKVNPAHREDFLQMGNATAPVKYVALPKSTITRGVVPSDLSNYLQGGRVVDNSPFYIKIGEVIEDAAGDSFRLGDRTLFSASSKKQAKEGAAKISNLSDLMRKNKDDLTKLTDEMIEAFDLRAVGIATVREASQFMKSHGLYKAGIKIQGIADRSLVDIGKDIPKGKLNREFISNNNRSQIFGQRTTGLQNILGTDSTKLDPIAATIQSLNITSEYASTTALRERSLAYFTREFKSSLQTNSTNPYDMLTAAVKPDVAQQTKQAIIAHQKFLTNMLGFTTDTEAGWKIFSDKIFGYVFDTKDKFFQKGGIKPAALQKKLEKREDVMDLFGKDPTTKIRALTFHTTLGMLSLPSMIMQAINVTNIIAISPKHGAKAAAQALPIRMALLSRDSKVIDKMAKHAKVIGFESEAEFKTIVAEIRRTGLDNIGTNHSLIAGISGLQLHGNLRRRVSQTSKTFFDQGELLNRITARLTATGIYKEAHPGKAFDSVDARAFIGDKTHTLTTGMSRADNQLGLRNNVASIPFQFWSYPMRLTSAMLPKSAGGSVAFTGKEKARLATMNLALWGGAGIPLVNLLTDHIAQNSEMDPVSAKLITNGLFDTSLYVMSGGEIDSNMSDRVGTAMFYQQIWDSFTGDKEAIEVMSGASGSRVSQIGGALSLGYDFVRLGMASDANSMTDTGLRMIAGVSSGANNWFKLHLALKHGQIYSRNGKALAGITVPEAFAQALGIPTQTYARLGQDFEQRQNRKDLVKEYEALYTHAIRARDEANTPQEIDIALELLVSIGVLASEEESGIQSEALQKAMRSVAGKNMMDKQIQQYYKDQLSGKKVNQNMAREAERQRMLEEKE